MAQKALKYFTENILPCSRRMYAAAMAITCDSAMASDAVQTAMLRLWDKLRSGEVPENPQAYCLMAVRNISLTELEHSRRLVSISAEYDIEDGGTRAETSISLSETEVALGRLSAKERQAVEMSAYAASSSEEIARAMGISSANARQILSRGRRKLRSFFEK